MLSIGNRLREERARLRMSQAAMAEAGHVSSVSQGHYELDRRAPDADYLAALAERGLDVAYVITGTRSQPLDPEESALLQRFRAAAPAVRAAVIGALSTVEIPEPSEFARRLDNVVDPLPGTASKASRSVVFRDRAHASQVVNGDQHIAGDQVVGSAPPARPRAPAKPRKSR